MNQSGQASSVFKLAIFAAVAVLLVYLVSTFFQQAQKDPIKELKDAVEQAQAKAGIGSTKTITFEKNFAVDAKKVFDTDLRSVSFQCSSEYCANKTIDLSERNFAARQQVQIQFTPRCVFEKNIYNCRIYFGTPPAQLKISGTQLNSNYDLSKDKVELNFSLENTGKQNAANSKIEVKIFRKENFEGNTIENLYSETQEKTAPLIAPQGKEQQFFQLPVTDTGDYSVEITVFGPDSGQDIEKLLFTATGTLESPDCRIGEKMEAFLNETMNKCITRYSCSGCERAGECVQKWTEQKPETQFQEATKELAYEITEPVNGACQ
ncbi:MAG: hypothetical protein AABW85_03940 [archaeon]